MTNENVLEGYRCPKCNSEEPFNIHGSATFLLVEDDGCSDFMAMEWLPSSSFECCLCGYTACAHTFEAFKAGDKVYWTDPADDECSRTYNIAIIEYLDDRIVRITEHDGSCLECYRKELA